MKTKENMVPAFLTSGGEMGELIRSFDWSKTALGDPAAWPLPLRIAVRIMLDTPFGMYIAWGDEYIQLYNDGYRPILGSTKHPQALGIGTRQTFAEVWPTIGPMFAGVMQGIPVGFPDFVLHLDRNGFVEECVFDFSYSPIRLEDGEVAGVLVTVIETTEKVKAVKALKESLEEVSLAKLAIQKNEENLRSTILQAPVAMCIFKGEHFTVDLANDKMFELWGKTAKEMMHKPIFEALPEAKNQGLEAIVTGVYTTGKTFYAEGVPVTLPRNGGIELVYINLVYEPYREADGKISGIIAVAIDVTAQLTARKQIELSEKRFSNILTQSIMAIGILDGPNAVITFANDSLLAMWGKDKNVIGKPLLEALPEIKDQKFPELISGVYNTGVPYEAFETKAILVRGGISQDAYFNFVYQPYTDIDNNIKGITLFAAEVTEQVLAKKEIEASEKRFINIVHQSPFAFAILKGKDMVVSLANDTIKQVWGKGKEVEGKPLFELLPELKKTVFPKLFDDVYTTGIPHLENEILARLEHDGVLKDMFFNLVYQPLLDADDTILGVTIIGVEVTHQVIAKKQIEANEKRLSDERMVLYNSFMNAPAGISILKGDTHIVEFANAEYEKLVDRKMTPGKTAQELFPEVEQQGLIAILHNVFSTGEPFFANEFPVELINKSTGKLDLHYYNSAIQPIKDEKGNIERLLTHGVEVTQQVEARKQIEEVNHQLRLAATLTDNIADAVVATDMDYKTISWNKGAENLYGYTSEEVMGNYAMELLGTQFLSDEDKSSWEKSLDATGKWQGEVRQMKKDGEFVSVLVSIAYVYDENGKTIAVVTVNRDITERKKAEEELAASEEKFRGLAEALPHLVWITDEKGGAIYASEKWQEYSGSNPYETGNWQSIVHPDDMEAMTHAWTASLTTGDRYNAVARLKNKENEYRWHLAEGVPLRNGEEQIVKWVGAFTDIHEEKLKEEQKDEFISIASHEMKTPLTTAKGYIELLLQSLSEENKSVLYATKASQAIERLRKLISELLDASKVQNGKLNYNITTFDFNEMLEETIENFQLGVKSHFIRKTGTCSQKITGDRGRLQQVVINLLSNAIKYSPKADSVLVNVVQEDDKIQVSVQDFGVGMSAQHLNKIFDRYYRVQEHAAHFQGLGIGLYVSNNIIERHQGEMWVESAPDSGSTFCFTIPAS